MLREQISAILKEGNLFYHYLEARDGLEGFKALLSHRVDLVLCDLEMPRMDGFKFLSLMLGREELKDIPVIFLTGRVDREVKIKGLDLGASDFVTKPFDAGELVARVKVQLKIKSLQDELKRSNALLKELSNTDPLTQLFNRRYLMDAIEKECQRVVRKGGTLCLIMLDIDHFKKINDTYGHQEGDNVLQKVAFISQKGIRAYDIASRYGGEEFALVLPDATMAETAVIAERLRQDIERHVFNERRPEMKITASMGIAVFPSVNIQDATALFKAADDALYLAKAGGRNRVVSAT